MLALLSLKNVSLAGSVCATLCVLAAALSAAPPSYHYDMTPYEKIAKESLKPVGDGDMKGALKKAQELEAKWDSETSDLQKADPALWNLIDQQMDAAIEALMTTDAKKGYLEKVARVPKSNKK